MKRPGRIKVLTVLGVPIYVYWSFPFGPLGVLIAAHFADFDPLIFAYCCLGLVFVVCAHELGHFLVARSLAVEVLAVELSIAGGRCEFELPHRLWHSFAIYSAGLGAQLFLFALCKLSIAGLGTPDTPFARCMIITFTIINPIVALINIIPRTTSRGFATDGRVLWLLTRHALGRGPHPHPRIPSADEVPVFPPDTGLLSIPHLVPKDFHTGVEILNDRVTPMEFVTTALMEHLDFTREEATEKMLAIHVTGGMLWPLPTTTRAQQVADGMMADAKKWGHPLQCRAVNAQPVAPSDDHKPSK